MRIFDQTGNSVFFNQPAKRIVSLVPSQTELLSELGLEEEVVGITKFCIYPEHWFRNKTRVGGTKDFNIEKIKQLKPDLILANKEENTAELVLELMHDFKVWTSDVRDIDSALDMIEKIGMLCGREDSASQLSTQIRNNFHELREQLSQVGMTPFKTAYYIWKDPWLVAGIDTFIHHMLGCCGLKNIADLPRYPEMNPDQLHEKDPELILLSSEPYPFNEKDRLKMQSDFPGAKIILVDGEYFSWYGARMKKAPAYFKSLFY